jgi:hypothetical protein
MIRILKRLARIAVAYFVILTVCFTEDCIYTSAWGGPVTILIGWALLFLYAGIATVGALIIGLVFKISALARFWQKLGRWTLLISLIGIAGIFSANSLGLRNHDPVTNYRLMDSNLWWTCLFFVAFPIVNGPKTAPSETSPLKISS